MPMSVKTRIANVFSVIAAVFLNDHNHLAQRDIGLDITDTGNVIFEKRDCMMSELQ